MRLEDITSHPVINLFREKIWDEYRHGRSGEKLSDEDAEILFRATQAYIAAELRDERFTHVSDLFGFPTGEYFQIYLGGRFPERRKVELTGLERRAINLAATVVKKAMEGSHTSSADLSQHPHAVSNTDETTLRWLGKRGTNPILYEHDTGEEGVHYADIEPDDAD